MAARASLVVAAGLCAVLAARGGQSPRVEADVAAAAIAATGGLVPNLDSNIARPLRYRPEGADFVIEDGQEFFNRPLYGGHTAFRVDAGDRPEFTLYLPGRGGNLRFGLRRGGSGRWLHEARHTVSRYRPGSMRYEVRDPLLGEEGRLDLVVLATAATEGLVVRAVATGTPADLELVFAFGGVTGQRGARDGDIGTEKVPIGEYFQLQPEFCAGNAFTVAGREFTLTSRAAVVRGLSPPDSRLAVGEAANWASLDALVASEGVDTVRPVVVGHAPLRAGLPAYVSLQRLTDAPAYGIGEVPRIFAESERHFEQLRSRVVVDTPDPYINAAAAALNVAADAVWDEPSGTVQHGAVAWRTKLLGWRGPYAMDALGWHDRARRHLTYWAGRQNTSPVPDALPPPDEASNLARSEAALHSNGDMSNSHYDMNLVYVDALFRHLLWTGDRAFAREAWPVIERHLSWERRLFRRPFGPEGLPLYEGYAAIWASDDLQYHGGGVAHASAYNYFHNDMAARVAALIGIDPAPYRREADAIARAMRTWLWLDETGSFAEFKDQLGAQRTHPAAGLWTIYHVLDSGLPTSREAWRLTAYVDREIPAIPVRGPGVPDDERYAVLATTNWMPYSWSVNNVVMSEVAHTALAYWQSGRADEASRLLKSALLASMFMGICPGNVGSMSYLDVYRRESQRDFADPSGVLSRALVEGLFGIRPDALAGALVIAPGFPSAWDRASIHHPDVDLVFHRDDRVDTYAFDARFARPLGFRLRIPARFDRVSLVTVDGRPTDWRAVEDSVNVPRIEVVGPPGPHHEVRVAFAGAPLPWTTRGAHPRVVGSVDPRDIGDFERRTQGQMRWWQPPRASLGWLIVPPVSVPPASFWKTPAAPGTRWDPVDLSAHFNDRVTEIFKRGKYVSPRSPHVSLAIPSQGIGGWAGGVNAMAEIDDTGLRARAGANAGRLVLPNGVPFETPGPGTTANVAFVSQWDNYPRELVVPLSGRAARIYLLMAGSTNWMQSRIDNGEVLVTYEDGTRARLALENPSTWWPIDQDYFIDDFAFARPGPIPPRVDLKTGAVRILDPDRFKGQGRAVPGGAATVLELRLASSKPLRSLAIRALSNEVVIGLMAATLER